MIECCSGSNDTTRGALIAGIAAIVGGLLSGALQTGLNWFNRPTLKIDVQDKVAPPNVTEASWKENDRSMEIVFARVSVRNTGRSGALNCRVFLIKVDEVISGNTVNPREVWESAQIPWSGHSFDGKNLPNGLTAFVDLARFDKSTAGWEFPAEIPVILRDELRTHKGTYDFKILVTSENAKPKCETISVNYEGDWNKVRIWKKELSKNQ